MSDGYDFANLLFAGPCNRACPFCIGKQLPDDVNVDNLDVFPPRGIEAFLDAIRRHRIREIALTGTVSDPQLYRHEARLIGWLRERLPADARIAVHTNGVRALARIEVLNLYDRACISLPSFVPSTYQRMTGSRQPPALAAIVRAARIPIKVSCVVGEPNVGEIDDFIARCGRIGVRRVALRHMVGERAPRFRLLAGRQPVRFFKANPVYDVDGVEVTVWDFAATECRSINLLPDGTLAGEYLLPRVSLGHVREAREASRGKW